MRKQFLSFLSGSIFAIAQLVLPGQALGGDMERAGPPRASIPEMKQAPKLDGVINENEWRDAIGNYGFVNIQPPERISNRRGSFRVGRKEEILYFAFRTEAPPKSEILTRTKPDGKQDLIGAFHDDSIEMVLAPKHGRKSGDRTFYHIIFNANGALFDWAINPDDKTNPVNKSWRLPKWKMKNTCHDGWWDVEVAIPLSSLDANVSDLNSEWGMTLSRNWKRPFMQSQWAPGYLKISTIWSRCAGTIPLRLSRYCRYTKKARKTSR